MNNPRKGVYRYSEENYKDELLNKLNCTPKRQGAAIIFREDEELTQDECYGVQRVLKLFNIETFVDLECTLSEEQLRDISIP